MSVRYDVDGRVATITLDRPEQRNAVDPELTEALGEAVAAFEADPEVWVAVLTGAGPNFCAGADLKALAAGRAAELVLTGERLGAEEAHRYGMVNHLVPAEEVLMKAREIADRICANAPVAVRESLAVVRDAYELTEQQGWDRSAQAMARARASEDAQEGPRAFAEKRAPRWTGR